MFANKFKYEYLKPDRSYSGARFGSTSEVAGILSLLLEVAEAILPELH